MTLADDLDRLGEQVAQCRACPRLVAWREQAAREKRAAFADQDYWGRPVPGWGDPEPRLLLAGLAPAAHGANRTGRIFTGDRSGDWLFASLHRVGLAAIGTSTHVGDGQRLHGTRMVCSVRCAPPANKPTADERDRCAHWWDAEWALVGPSVRVVVALGAFGWGAALSGLARAGVDVPVPAPRFAHGAEVALGDRTLLGCYHPSPLNTSTGRLTAPMLDDVLGRAAALAGITPPE